MNAIGAIIRAARARREKTPARLQPARSPLASLALRARWRWLPHSAPTPLRGAAASSARDLVMRVLKTQAALEPVQRAVADGTAGHTTIWIKGSRAADLAHIAGGPAVVR